MNEKQYYFAPGVRLNVGVKGFGNVGGLPGRGIGGGSDEGTVGGGVRTDWVGVAVVSGV